MGFLKLNCIADVKLPKWNWVWVQWVRMCTPMASFCGLFNTRPLFQRVSFKLLTKSDSQQFKALLFKSNPWFYIHSTYSTVSKHGISKSGSRWSALNCFENTRVLQIGFGGTVSPQSIQHCKQICLVLVRLLFTPCLKHIFRAACNIQSTYSVPSKVFVLKGNFTQLGIYIDGSMYL